MLSVFNLRLIDICAAWQYIDFGVTGRCPDKNRKNFKEKKMIGNNVKNLRIKAGLTQKDLADKLFVTPQAVSRWENEEVEPSSSTIALMAKIFNVSTDEILGVESVAPTKSAPQEYQAPKQMLALCEKCNKPIYDTDDIKRFATRVSHGRTYETQKHLYCKSCYDEKVAANKRAQEARLQEQRDAGVKRRIWSFVGGIATGVIVLLIMLWLTPAIAEIPEGLQVPLSIVMGIASFTLVSCLILYNNFIGDVMGSIFEWAFVRFPGLIFELSLDGLIWLLTVKLLFWVLGILLGIVCGLLAITVGLVVSLFVYPFAIVKNFRNPELTVDD
jgi:transcriptional regulator with XRE-family HTH domain